jgi:hypothetical protein
MSGTLGRAEERLVLIKKVANAEICNTDIQWQLPFVELSQLLTGHQHLRLLKASSQHLFNRLCDRLITWQLEAVVTQAVASGISVAV